MTGQTVLPISQFDEFTLEQFIGDNNSVLVDELNLLASRRRAKSIMYIWGAAGVGKTHLLNAVCKNARELGRPGLYLNLQQLQIDGAEADFFSDLLAMESGVFVGIDNLDQMQSDGALEQIVFKIYESVLAKQGDLLIAGSLPIREMGVELPDLKSRLALGGEYRIEEMQDQDKKSALQKRAHSRGFALDDSVMEYILSRFSRDTHSLFSLLDKLDDASLKDHRKVTIPFIRSIITADSR